MTTRLRRSMLVGAAILMLAGAVTSAQVLDPATGKLTSEPVVTGAPYSAEGTTVVKARMFDGTRIDRSVTAKFFRDSAGRVRREQTVLGLEALDPANDFRSIVTIVDPVEGVIISLNPATRTAHKLSLGAAVGAMAANTASQATRKRESLGTRDIDGFTATGWRDTVTIPAGQIGNDRPIEIVDEQWESTELKVVLFSRHTDPRTGDIEFRLTKVTRAEPARELFKVPAGFKGMGM